MIDRHTLEPRGASFPERQGELQRWFRTGPGNALLTAERRFLAQELSHWSGRHILQWGLPRIDLLAHGPAPCQRVLASGTRPHRRDSVDVVVMPHVLEFVPEPCRALREAAQFLAAKGILVILGFQPWSLWGLWRLAVARRQLGQAPWCGRFLSPGRLRRWLLPLGMAPLRVRGLRAWTPPGDGTSLSDRLQARWVCGGAYGLVAGKRLIPVASSPRCWSRPALGKALLLRRNLHRVRTS